jgi:hypothetical protein
LLRRPVVLYCTSSKYFGHRFKDEIGALTRNLTVYVSSNDRALLMSRILSVLTIGPLRNH